MLFVSSGATAVSFSIGWIRLSKVDLFAAIRRDSHAGVSGRTIAQKYQVSRRTVRAALTSVWPQPRKHWHTVKRIYDQLIDEHGMHDVSYLVVRSYVADRKPQIRAEAGRGPVKVFIP